MYKLIVLPQPILINDEEIKEGDWYWDTLVSHLEKVGPLKMIGLADESSTKLIIQSSVGTTSPIKASKKIIAGLPDLPKLDLSLIADEIGWVDVEKLAIDLGLKYYIGGNYDFENGVTKGISEYQFLNEKKYSEEDLKYAMFQLFKNGSRSPKEGREGFGEIYNRVIQSLSKPKEYLVEVEVEDYFIENNEEYTHSSGAKGSYSTHNKRPKITNNTIKVTKIL